MNLTLTYEQSHAIRPAIVAKVQADKVLDHDVALLLAGMGVDKAQWTGDIREEGDVFVFTMKDEEPVG